MKDSQVYSCQFMSNPWLKAVRYTVRFMFVFCRYLEASNEKTDVSVRPARFEKTTCQGLRQTLKRTIIDALPSISTFVKVDG